MARSGLLATSSVGDPAVDLRRDARQRHRRFPDPRTRTIVHVHLPGVRAGCSGRLFHLVGAVAEPPHRGTDIPHLDRRRRGAPDGVLERSAVARPVPAKPLERVHRASGRPRRAEQEHRARFLAFDRFLEAHQDFQGRVNSSRSQSHRGWTSSSTRTIWTT